MTAEVKCVLAEKFLLEEYNELDTGAWATITIDGKEPVLVFTSSIEECPYLGLGFADGRYGVVGGKVDSFVELNEMFWYLDQKTQEGGLEMKEIRIREFAEKFASRLMDTLDELIEELDMTPDEIEYFGFEE